MRIDDYRFYSRLCVIIGIVVIVIGVLLPIAMLQLRYNVSTGELIDIRFPYLFHGISLVVIGIAIIIVSNVLSREYKNKDLREKQRRTEGLS